LSAAAGASAFGGATCAVCDGAVTGADAAAVAGTADWASALVEMPATETTTNPRAKTQERTHTTLFLTITISSLYKTKKLFCYVWQTKQER
jgi:hypothetical protein